MFIWIHFHPHPGFKFLSGWQVLRALAEGWLRWSLGNLPTLPFYASMIAPPFSLPPAMRTDLRINHKAAGRTLKSNIFLDVFLKWRNMGFLVEKYLLLILLPKEVVALPKCWVQMAVLHKNNLFFLPPFLCYSPHGHIATANPFI